ncbi:dTDP-4-dehydrorhamnose 3,5-epimerase family protein [Candidatus Pelagibacter bacterium]|jgi:dTDP-4-dehydrorhamnose 3,5-epimerase|nr:dTDP-4-dehydrorhamnose 3,5-epimerase family protein [Candidatus Pelagibacter bacterium]
MRKFSKPYLIKKKKFLDKRGYFQELFLQKEIKIKIKFTALANSKKNVIRGMHFQLRNKQTKIISVISGKILDVAINLKKNSKEFGKIYYYILNEGDTVFIPNHYAHGYECLSKKASIIYHLDNYRDAKNESGIPFNDKDLKIRWKTKKPVISERDQNHFSFLDFKKKYKGL